jgi:hypothetical protein
MSPTPPPPDRRLVTNGRRERLPALLQQAKVSAALARERHGALESYGWSPARTAALEAEIAALEADVGTRVERTLSARHATAREQAAIDAAKRFLEQLRAALPMVLRSTKSTPSSATAFHAGRDLGRSTPRIATFLTKLRPSLAALEADFAPYFPGGVLAALEAASAALDEADVAQETRRAMLPSETARVAAAKGRVREALEDLQRVVRIAFGAEQIERTTFAEHVLRRAKRRRAGAVGPSPLALVGGDGI